MKALVLFSFLVCSINVRAQYTLNSPQNHSAYNKIKNEYYFKNDILHYDRGGYNPPGAKMKKVGTTLTVVGGSLIIGGIVMIAAADKTLTTDSVNNFTYFKDGKVYGGILMIVGGIAATTPGIILWVAGNKKYKHYEKMQEASLNLKGAGLSIKMKL